MSLLDLFLAVAHFNHIDEGVQQTSTVEIQPAERSLQTTDYGFTFQRADRQFKFQDQLVIDF